MCMPRNFGEKLVDGKIEEKKCKIKPKKIKKKIIYQTKVEFE
ncbi:MAG: lipid-A-disaccharide synthase [Nautiliaceae bacterium]